MTKEQKDKKIQELQNTLDSVNKELETLKNTPEKWQDSLIQPQEGYYHFINSDISDGFAVRGADFVDRKPEHAFRTKEQAELVKEKMLLMQEMFAFAHVRNEGWEPDWEDKYFAKYGIEVIQDKPEVEVYKAINGLAFGIVVKSRQIAEEMLSIFGERIKKYYNKQY